MTAPGDFSSGDVLTAADMNALPGGMMGNATNSSPARLTASAQTYATVTFTAVSGRMYRAIGQLYATGPDAAGELVGWLVCDGTRRGQSATYFDTTDNEAGISCIAIFTGSGSFTVNFQALGGDGVTDAYVENFQGIDPFLVVEDIGPS